MTRAQFVIKVSKWILKRRTVLGWTQKDLARKTGLTQDWISHFESGRRMPDSFAFHKLQQHLGKF